MKVCRLLMQSFLIMLITASSSDGKGLIVKIDALSETMYSNQISQVQQKGFTTEQPSCPGSVTFALIEDLLTQQETPILCVNPHLFENLLVFKIGFEKLKDNPQVAPLLQKINETKQKFTDHIKKIKALSDEEIVTLNNDLLATDNILSTSDIEPTRSEPRSSGSPSTQAGNSDISSIIFSFFLSYRLNDVLSKWELFKYENTDKKNNKAYLLVPRVNNKDIDLNAFNINPTHFKKKSMQELENKIRDTQSYQLTVPRKRGKFDFVVLDILNDTLKTRKKH